MAKIDRLTMSGNFEGVLGLSLHLETSGQLLDKLGITDRIIDGHRIEFDDDFDEDLFGRTSELVIEEMTFPTGIDVSELIFESWEPLYMDGDGLEILGIAVTGTATSTVQLSGDFHDEDCSGIEGECEIECNFNTEWWNQYQRDWEGFYVTLTHRSNPGLKLSGWFRDPPDFI